MLVVGDETTLKVHVHTDEPGRARPRCSTAPATVSHLDVADMHEQVAERDARLARGAGADGRRAAACGALAVVSGDGMRALFEELGSARSTAARRSTRRPTTCSPASTRSPPRRSSCCPTAPNVVMAAERAAELSEKRGRASCRTRSQQAGLAAAVALRPAPRRRRERRPR